MSESPSRWRRLVDLLDTREPATALALLRIALGCVILYDLTILHAFDLVDVIYGDAREWHMGYRPRPGPKPMSVALFDMEAARATHAITYVAAVLFTIGAGTRVAGVVLIAGMVELALLHVDGDRGIDMMIRLMLVYLVLSGSHRTLAVDARIRFGAWIRPDAMIPAWPRYVILAQLVWMYFSAGIVKSGSSWSFSGGYIALHYILRYQHFVRWDMTWVPTWLTQIGTFTTVWFEMLAPLTLYALWRERCDPEGMALRTRVLRRFRFGWTVVGLSFHLILTVVMNIGIFTTGMMAFYLAWLRPRDLARLPWPALRPTQAATDVAEDAPSGGPEHHEDDEARVAEPS